ncbi:MAG: hypothetical protein DRP47_00155 [Candidatus Zixiibacteriota bacterium]|nr:MAG: hypothetical protein DRP47_00155 [candidate division Zixibacteria bacterium]
MAIRHLTDEELQSYLDRGDTCEVEHLETHMRSCKLCQDRFSQYQRLYAGLEQDNGYELSPGFSETVMTRLAIAAPEISTSRPRELLWAGVGLIATLCLVGYFIDLESIILSLARSFAPLYHVEQTVLTQIKDSLTATEGYPMPLLFSGLILLGVSVADSLLLSLRSKNICL